MLIKSIGALLATLIVVVISNFARTPTVDVVSGVALFVAFYTSIEVILLKMSTLGILEVLLNIHGKDKLLGAIYDKTRND